MPIFFSFSILFASLSFSGLEPPAGRCDKKAGQFQCLSSDSKLPQVLLRPTVSHSILCTQIELSHSPAPLQRASPPSSAPPVALLPLGRPP